MTSSAPTAPSNPGAADWSAYADDLKTQLSSLPSGPVAEHLGAAFTALGGARYADVIHHAKAALAVADGAVLAWRLLGLGYEGETRMPEALEAFQSAHQLDPGSLAILSDLGRLALTLGLSGVAIELFARALTQAPRSAHLAKQLSMALKDSHQYSKAVEVLSLAISNDRANAFLWNALGSVLLQQGDTESALAAVEQSLTLAAGWSEALYNRAIAKLELGDLAGSQADCDLAMKTAPVSRRAVIAFARAQARLAAGDLEDGWSDYDARLSPDFPTSPVFDVPGRPWDGREALFGARMLIVAEQGLGDEIMFSSVLHDVAEAVGPSGRLMLLAAPRLVPLLRRSFPAIDVRAAETRTVAGRMRITAPPDMGPVDIFTPMGSLGSRWRGRPSDWRGSDGFLIPDPQAAARWREKLATLGDRPKVGLSWKSLKTSGNRLKQYPAFEDWRPLLASTTVRFVTIQYGDCGAEIQSAARAGCEIWVPPGLDLTNDIDESAALCAGLDLVIGVGNASTNLAAATGTPSWFIFPPAAWPKLGTDRHPWFPQTRGFAAARFGQWDPVMTDVAQALDQWATTSVVGPPLVSDAPA